MRKLYNNQFLSLNWQGANSIILKEAWFYRPKLQVLRSRIFDELLVSHQEEHPISLNDEWRLWLF